MDVHTRWKKLALIAALGVSALGLLPRLALAQTAAGSAPSAAQSAGPAATPSAAQYDVELANKLGGNANGMRSYVLVVLRTGPTTVPEGPVRKKMFEGHFDNINRLAAEKKLVFAGPLDGVDGWRGIFVLATGEIEEAKRLVALDPVIINGEMVAEYHKLFGSAALMMVSELHNRIQKK